MTRKLDSKINSTTFVKTGVPTELGEPRSWYLHNNKRLPSPWIAYSSWLPVDMVEDLMRNKKDTAIGTKFAKHHRHFDSISNMEGALHTFVNPMVEVTMHGDYQWTGRHNIFRFGDTGGEQLGRKVLLSALVQPDYEFGNVMGAVVTLHDHEVKGSKYFPELLHRTVKQNDARRKEYDAAIHAFLVYHLTQSHIIPAAASVAKTALGIREAIEFIKSSIKNNPQAGNPADVRPIFIRHANGSIMSLEMMFLSAVHQVKNEFYLLEAICSWQGYVYSFNPPAIFAAHLGAQGTELLSLIHILALHHVQYHKKLSACRCIAWNDFATPDITSYLRIVVRSQKHIIVVSTDDIFQRGGTNEKSGHGLYMPPKDCENAMLVIHNNSDAFGQNIETEGFGGSLDGVIGVCSSAAGSLMRHRRDLCDWLFPVD